MPYRNEREFSWKKQLRTGCPYGMNVDPGMI